MPARRRAPRRRRLCSLVVAYGRKQAFLNDHCAYPLARSALLQFDHVQPRPEGLSHEATSPGRATSSMPPAIASLSQRIAATSSGGARYWAGIGVLAALHAGALGGMLATEVDLVS